VDDGYEELGVVDRQSETRAHIKIEAGCKSFCSYCAIPHARGRIRSRAEASILAEGRALAAAGYREVVLTGIHVCSYGADRGEGSHAVMALANQLAAIEGIERIRLGSLEPLSVTAEFLALARENAKLCPHFHLSLQSGSDSVLARMNRRYTTSKFREMVDHIRADFPTANLTTDIIVGFPGETEAEFMQTLSFCAEIGFGRIHVFRYSPRTGTPAASMAGQVDATISAARSQRLQDLADELALAYHQSCLGRPLEVLVEKTGSDQMAEGYSAEYVPVRISGAAAAAPGQIISVWPVAAERQFLLARHARAD
jgi:threonylcarbamoyladenosine tRNA methylthiotransferase MtaB